MKVGFSFGRCVRDIVNGVVAPDDVVVIVARTLMESEDQVRGVISHYMHRREYLFGLDQAECERVALQLYNSGKVFQPRKEGHRPGFMVQEDYVWMDLSPTVHEDNELVRKAWQQYQVALKLASTQRMPDQVHGAIPQQYGDRW